jgi:hypothetical protein
MIVVRCTEEEVRVTVELPGRKPGDEDVFLASWRGRDDPEALIEVISAAIEARRPQLAARLVGLLGEQVEIEPGSPVEQARRAAQMLMLPTSSPNDFAALQSAWQLARKLRIRRIKRRMRGGPRVPRASRRR